jgi:dipeptidyl aminopeptidase/acylaminoacyl peptidase
VVLAATLALALALAALPARAADAYVGRVVYVSNQAGNNDIYTINTDGTGDQRVTTDPADEFDPAWSPDGRKIAFVRNDDGNRDIWVMNPDGSDQQRLTDDASSDRYPSWSPDGKFIAFRSNRRPSTSFDIWKMRADGSAPIRVTADAGLWGDSLETSPAWSPDGRGLAFVSDRDGNREIYVANADGSNPRRMTNSPADDQFPSWSPDGSVITWDTNRDGNEEIYSMRSSDGGGQTNLTNNPVTDRYPAWSPDGTKIAFRSSRARSFDIFLMNPDGSDPTRLTVGLGRTMEPGFEGFSIDFHPPAGNQGAAGGTQGGGPAAVGPHHPSGGSSQRALKVQLAGAPRQHIVRQHGVLVLVRCSAACPYNLSGYLIANGSHKRIALTRVRGSLVAGKRTQLKLKLKRKQLKLAARLLAEGKSLHAVVSISAGSPASATSSSSAAAIVHFRR